MVASLAMTACQGELSINSDPNAVPGGPGGPGGPGEGPGDNNPDGMQRAEASLHRLNRLEYNNSVRDLLGTTLTPADNFPPDGALAGFDNMSEALTLTPALMDRYLNAAQLVVEDAFADRPEFQSRFEENDPRLTYSINRDANIIGGIIRLRGGSAQGTVDVTASGAHTLVVRAQGYINGTAAAPTMRVSVAGQNFDFSVPLTMGDTTFSLELTPGSHPFSFQALNFEENAAENRGNDIMFDYAVLRSDQTVEGPARSRLLTCDIADAACAKSIVTGFAKSAWRRPLQPSERTDLEALYDTVRTAGESEEASLKLALRAILSSPKFLYRYRTVEDANSAELLDPYVLASRLSYFLWSSTPDARLLQAAEDGTLSRVEGIRQTVAWMITDPRASALGDGFAEQWLDVRHLDQAAPSLELYPDFSDAVKEAMADESRLFFLDYLDNDAPIQSMLQPGFAYRSGMLAQHLGVPSMDSADDSAFLRVAVGEGDRRGVLALSAWLTARSNSERSSPIRRGAWIADNMLCAPVPPPPPGLDIAELMHTEGMTVRETLEAHRNDPACAGCHASLDILGMGFEVFDVVARYNDDPTLDSSGTVPATGAEFRGADGLAAVFDQHRFVNCVSKKLFTYAVGREPSREEVDELIEELGPIALTMTMPDLITAIVLSPSFSEPSPLR